MDIVDRARNLVFHPRQQMKSANLRNCANLCYTWNSRRVSKKSPLRNRLKVRTQMSDYPNRGRHFETIEQCAKRLAVSTSTIRRAIADGRLKAYGWSRQAPRLDIYEVDNAFTCKN